MPFRTQWFMVYADAVLITNLLSGVITVMNRFLLLVMVVVLVHILYGDVYCLTSPGEKVLTGLS